MKSIKYQIVSFVLFISCLLPLRAAGQYGERIQRHFVIAVDNAMPKYEGIVGLPSTRVAIEKRIKEIGISEGDKVSVVGYQLNLVNP